MAERTAFDKFLDPSNWAAPDADTTGWASVVSEPAPPEGQTMTEMAVDAGRQAIATGLDIGAMPFSGMQRLNEWRGDPDAAQRAGHEAAMLHGGADSLRSGMSDAGKRAAGAKFFPGEGEASVLEHPLSSATQALAGLAPYITALGVFPEGAISAAVAGGTLQLGQVVDNAVRESQDKSDADLQRDNPAYRAYREKGLSASDALNHLHDDMLTVGDLLGAVAAGSIGSGTAAKVLKSGAGVGTLRQRMGTGSVEAGLGMGVGNMDADLSQQRGEVAAGKKSAVDLGQTLHAGLEGVGSGAFIGATAGALHRPSKVERADERGPDAAQRAALDANATEGQVPGAPEEAKAPPAPQPATDEPAAPVPPEVADAAQRVQEAAPEQPAAPVTSPGSPAVPDDVAAATQRVQAADAPAVSDDTGMNTPEAPDTIEAQRQKLVNGEVPAVMYPKGTPVPKTPPAGMRRLPTKRGVFDYDPNKLTPKQITDATKAGRENEILGLGPMSKDDVAAASAATGEPTVAVVERAPDGTEVKGTLATPSTVDVQAPTIEAGKSAGNTVSVEPPDHVLAERTQAAQPTPAPALSIATAPTPQEKVAAVKARAAQPSDEAPKAPRVLPDLSPEGRAADAEAKAAAAAEAARVKRENAAMEKREVAAESGPVALEKKSKVEKAKRVADAKAAKDIFEQNTPKDITVPRTAGERAALQSRLRRISDAADAAGIKVPTKVGYDSTADHVIWLREVKDLLKRLEDGKAHPEHILDFLTREASARAGDFSVMRSERRAAGETQSRGAQQDVERVGAKADFIDTGPENTSVARTGRGPARLDDGTEKAEVKRSGGGTETIDRAKGGEVRRVEITPEERAKYETTAKPVARAETPKKKVAAIKERAKAEHPKAEAKAQPETITDHWTRGERPAPRYETGRRTIADVFHGTTQVFDKFLRGKLGAHTGADSAKGAFFFSRSPETANYYAHSPSQLTPVGNHEIIERAKARQTDPGAKGSAAVEERYGALTDEQRARYDELERVMSMVKDPTAVAAKIQDLLRASDELRLVREMAAGRAAAGDPEEGARVVMARVTMENPLVVDFGGRKERPERFSNLIEKAKADGHDGVIFTNTFDGGPKDTIYAVFNEAGIHDRAGNRLANRGYDPKADLEKGLSHDDASRAADQPTVIWGPAGAAEPLHTSTVSEILSGSRVDAIRGAGAKLIPFLRRRLGAAVGHLPVHLVDRRGMVDLEGDVAHPSAGFYDTADNHIVMRVDTPREAQAHTILHESVHAATKVALDREPAMRTLLQRIIDEVRGAFGDDPLRATDYSDRVAPLREHYGMSNPEEFLAEAMSNGAFQRKMMESRISAELARDLGLDQWSKHSFWSGLVAFVRHALKLPRDTHTALEGAMRVMEHLVDGRPPEGPDGAPRYLRNIDQSGDRELGQMFRSSFKDALDRGVDGLRSAAGTLAGNPAARLTDAVRNVATRPGAGDRLQKIGRVLATNDQYRQNVEHLFPGEREQNVVRRIFDGVERQGTFAQHLQDKGNDIVRAMARAQKSVPEGFTRFADLLNDATMFGVDPAAPIGQGRNAHLALSQEHAAKAAKGGLQPHELPMSHWEAQAQHPKLAERYNALVSQHPEFGPLMDETFRFFHEAQQDMARGHIENVLRSVDAKGDLAARAAEIRDARPSEEWQEKIEKELGEPALHEILKAKQLAGSEGPYVPMMRHGDWVVLGRYAVKEPANAIARNGDTWEFGSRKEAHDFANESGLHYSVRTTYYDRATGQRTTKGDIAVHGDPEQRFAVTLQRDHVEFHDSRANAEASRRELAGSGALDHLSEVLDRRQHDGLASELTSAGMQTILKRLEQTERYKTASATERAEMRKALAEASLSMRAGNRVQSRRLPRRRVGGASSDLVRNMYEYNMSQANYRAKLKFRSQIDDAISEMRKHESEHQFEKGATERSIAANEIERRARAADPSQYTGALTDFTRRIGTLSYIDRMMRPSHLILHQTHLPMITVPIIAGRHGIAAAYGMMVRVWSLATRAYAAGGRDFVASVADSLHKGVDYTALMKQSFAREADAARLGRMFDTLGEIGLIHPQGSLDGAEVMRNSPSRDRGAIMGTLDTALGKLDTTFRHLTNATEAINRYVGATMAYRLEFDRLTREGKSEAAAHDLAVEYARHILANTQGFYSATNAAPLFKNPWLKPFLQFRQFPQMMYHLLGRTMVQAFTGATREEKVQAVKSLALILASHAAMTGALGGLPLEAPMVATNVAKGLGLTDTDWKDVERAEYAWAVRTFGKEGAELLMHGLGADLGVDVHHRMGLNSFFTFGLPDEMDAKSVWGFLGQQALGAPGGLVADALSGISRMSQGDLAGGAAKAFPLQALRDIRSAWSGGSAGYQYTPAERAAKLAGFTPAGEARHYEAQRDLVSQRDAFETERRKLMSGWISATPADKASAWKAIQRFNAGKPKEAQITMKGLQAAIRRKPAAEIEGVRFGNRSKFIADGYRQLH